MIIINSFLDSNINENYFQYFLIQINDEITKKKEFDFFIRALHEMQKEDGVPTGIRTPVTAVKGRCPRPLDDRDVLMWTAYYVKIQKLSK